jgi:anti-sigma-K factor RskA
MSNREPKMNKPCPSDLLDKYFDREVTEEERTMMEGHLSQCQACRDVLTAMDGLRHLIKDPVDKHDQEENFHWVWQKIEREIQRKEEPAWKEFLGRWLDVGLFLRRRVWIPAAAVAVAIVIALTPYFFRESPPSSSDFSVVEYVESQSHNVMVYESEKGTMTVIWLLDDQEGEDLSKS